MERPASDDLGQHELGVLFDPRADELRLRDGEYEELAVLVADSHAEDFVVLDHGLAPRLPAAHGGGEAHEVALRGDLLRHAEGDDHLPAEEDEPHVVPPARRRHALVAGDGGAFVQTDLFPLHIRSPFKGLGVLFSLSAF